MRWPTLVVTVLILSSCEGAEGPTGPTGPQGPQGPPGPAAPAAATRVNYGGVIPASGTVVVQLPPAAGNNPAAPPLITCWTSNSSNGAWLVVSDGRSGTTPYCAMGLVDGVWVGTMLQGIPGWYAAITIVY